MWYYDCNPPFFCRFSCEIRQTHIKNYHDYRLTNVQGV